MSLSRRAKVAWMIGGGVVLALVVAGVAVLFAFRDVASTLDEEEAGLTVITGGGRPGDYGLYVYATTGYETTDALAGARHDYPAETYLTIQPGGCGTLVRWLPLEQRYEEWDYCPDGRMAGWDTFHQWFQFGNTDDWQCPEPVPVLGEPGDSWTIECTRAETDNAAAAAQLNSFEVVGYESLTVGGEEVETLHVRVGIVGTGGSVSTGQQDTWYLVGTQLPVRRVLVHDSITDSRIGEVQYYEEAEINLTSLVPRG
ncbi:MAG TPA: hypothetical protein VLS92_09575 [Acidimicrobiia bacterium]|nr:hypothetical protein [Acidimicrobiia bacterium]